MIASHVRRGQTSFVYRRCMSSVLSHDVHKGGKDGKGEQTAVWLHGIVGSKKNWRTVSKTFLGLPQAASFDTSVVLEHRGHGKSHGLQGANTVSNCSKDFEELMLHTQRTPTLINAHSFGGKVALKYVENQLLTCDAPTAAATAASLSQVWMLDTLPGIYSDQHDGANSVFNVLQELRTMPRTFPSRDWVVAELQARGISRGIALWLGTSVVSAMEDGTGNRVAAFGFDTSVIMELFNDFVALDMWPTLEAFGAAAAEAKACGSAYPTIHYLRAGKNSAWTPDLLERFRALEHSSGGGVQLHAMMHCGHWLHTEDPAGMLELILDKSSFRQ